MYTGLLSNSLSYLEVWEVVKKCVILLHGTAKLRGDSPSPTLFYRRIQSCS